jgi:hypothetical protein
MPIQSRRAIDSFLAQKRIAFIGASRSPSHFSRKLFAELAARGHGFWGRQPRPCGL